MKTIIQDKKECLICGSWNIEDHCIFYDEKELSEKYGLKVWLCPTHLNGSTGVFGKDGYKLDLEIKKLGQKAFEWKYTREEFIKIFRRNYL